MQPLDTGDPSAIGPYRLLGRLGAGGMGRVYLGRSAGGRTVAVKAVHPHFATDEEFRARFRREVAAVRRVGTGPGGLRWTAPVLDADPEAEVPWVVTAYVAGPSLTRAVADQGPLPERTVRALGAGLAEALTAVHALGLVHRDVKPSNVLLALDGPRLIDFGIARATDGTSSLTSTGVSVGSPGYMAPEQILGRGPVDGAADVFSMGSVLTYAATGASPFPGDSSASLLYKVVHEEPELDGLSGELREIVVSCLAKDPAARPAPAEAARLLAADGAGAGALVAAGWLPGPLVEEVSRSVVRLLDLDTAGAPATPPPFAPSFPEAPAPGGPATPPSVPVPAPFPPDAPSGPVPFSSASLGGGAPLGVFGPPVPPPGAPIPPALSPEQDPERPGRPRLFSVSADVHTYTATASDPGGGSGTGAGTGVATTGAGGTGTPGVPGAVPGAPGTAPAPGPGQRPARRRGCTVALAVTVAVAFAGFAVQTFGPDFFGGGTNDSADGDTGAERPSGTTPATREPTDSLPGGSEGGAPSGSASASAGELPASFVGTWSGPVTERSGLPHGTFTAAFSAGAKGEDVVRTTTRITVLGTTVECFGIGKLVSAKGDLVEIEERTDDSRRSSGNLCTTGGVAGLTFKRTSATTLDYASDEEAAGTPKGTLTKR
ncbi:serine/threonine-protein kinase [Streptomyces sp. NPDC093085]|uniref:serine/threonine-protein kinase n=1 Tax=Streptomyces sp. NPDC093085 TaxID=3155068 RepID=UPI003416A2A7